MSRNGSGVYSLPAGNPVVTGTTISSSWANTTLSDIASALTASIANDGQTLPVANLPMGTYAHTGVGNATARTMYASAAQVEDGTLNYLTSVSGTNTITATAPLSMLAYATGQTFRFIAAGANTSSVTLNINSIGAKAIVRTDGSALVSGDIASGAAVQVFYDGTNFQLLSDANGQSETVSNLTITGNLSFTGTGNRIRGDFSNATLANRVWFQTSTTNNSSTLGVLPNGTSTVTSVIAFGGSDSDNASRIQMRIDGASDAQLRSEKSGTGSYLPMTFYTSGSERMRIDTSGNVGIGTSSPSGKLHVSGDVYLADPNNAVIYSSGATGGYYFRKGNSGSYTNQMVIDSSGNVGIGTSSPASYGKLGIGISATASATNNIIGIYQSAGADAAALRIAGFRYTGTAQTAIDFIQNSSSNFQSQIAFSTDSGSGISERMRIDSSGNVLVGTTSQTTAQLESVSTSNTKNAIFAYVNAASSTAYSAVNCRKYDNNNTTSQIYISFTYNQGTAGAGGIQGNGASGVQFYSSSDARLKENIVSLEPQLENILKLKPSKFDFIDGPKDCTGFIAQEMEEVYPDAVGKTSDGFKTIGGISIMETRLIKAIQELSAKVDTLQAELNTLKGN